MGNTPCYEQQTVGEGAGETVALQLGHPGGRFSRLSSSPSPLSPLACIGRSSCYNTSISNWLSGCAGLARSCLPCPPRFHRVRFLALLMTEAEVVNVYHVDDEPARSSSSSSSSQGGASEDDLPLPTSPRVRDRAKLFSSGSPKSGSPAATKMRRRAAREGTSAWLSPPVGAPPAVLVYSSAATPRRPPLLRKKKSSSGDGSRGKHREPDDRSPRPAVSSSESPPKPPVTASPRLTAAELEKITSSDGRVSPLLPGCCAGPECYALAAAPAPTPVVAWQAPNLPSTAPAVDVLSAEILNFARYTWTAQLVRRCAPFFSL